MRRRTRFITMLLAVLALCLGLAASILAENAVSVQMMKTEGEVSVTNNSARELTVMEKMRLYNGYFVSTDEKSYAWVNLDDAKLAKLDALSQMELRKDGKALELLVHEGELLFNVTEPLEDDETLDICTATMVAGIRGTCGWIRSVNSMETEICILEGKTKCTVTNPLTGELKTRVVNSGEYVRFWANATEGTCGFEVRKLKREQIPGFVLKELVDNPNLLNKIFRLSGLDLRDLTAEEAQERLDQDEEEDAQRLQEIVSQDGKRRIISRDPVWKTQTDAATEKTTERQTTPATEPVSENAGETATELPTETMTEPVTESETTVPATESETTPVTESETTRPTESETTPVTESETTQPTESETMPVTESETTQPTESETESETESGTEPVTEPVTESETEPVTEPVTESETEPVTEPVTEAPQIYTITFDNGSSVSEIQVTEQSTAGADMPSDPVREGHTFVGWYTADDKEFTSDTVVAGNLTVTARWKVRSYTVTYMLDGEQYGEVATYEYGAAVTVLSKATKEGYTVSDWSRTEAFTMPAENVVITATSAINSYTVTYLLDGEQAGETETYEYGASVTVRSKGTKEGYTVSDWSRTEAFTMPAENVVITATSTVNSYTVTYMLDGEQIGEPETYEYGASVTIREKATKEGYTVSDWSRTEAFTMPAENVLITATSKINSYTVTYLLDGVQYGEIGTYEYGAPVTTREKVVKEGYTVTDWSKTGDFTMPAENVVITATSKINSYTVTYLLDGAQSGEIETYEYGASVKIREKATKEGYTVSDWSRTEDFTMPAGNVLITATSTINSYTVMYMLDGEQVGEAETYEYGASVTIREKATKEGYTVSAWDRTENFTMPAEDVVINATSKINSYTVTYLLDGEQYGEVETYEYGASVTVRAKATREGYTVSDWSRTEAFTMSAENVEITATSKINSYTVTYLVDGAQSGEIETYEYGATVKIREKATKEGYTVSDWSRTEDFTMPTGNVVITATSMINSYTVTYKLDGEQAGEAETYEYGATVTVREKAAKEGYTVTDWSRTGSFTMPAGNVEITATSTVNSYTVTYMLDGEQLGEAETYEYGVAVTIREKAAKEGYTVSDWSRTEDFIMPAGNVEIKATSTINSYTVTYLLDEVQAGEPETYEYGASVTVRAKAEKTGYTVTDWSQTGSFTMPAGDVEITATSTINSYTVTYLLDDEQVGEVETYKYGESVTIRAKEVKEGYTVSDWSRMENFAMPAENVEITATSTINSYTVTYNLDNVQVGEAETYEYGASVTIREKATKEGYTVSAWDRTENFTMPAENVVIAATSSINSYTVTYKLDDEVVGEVETYKYGDSVTIREKVSKEGYTVSNWSITESFTMPARDVEITATSTINQYTITLDANSGMLPEGSDSKITADYNTKVTLPKPTKTGYTFNGWFTATDGGDAFTAGTPVTADCALYAHWTAAEAKIVFNPNGGTGGSTEITGVTDGAVSDTFPVTEPSREGYNFIGWYADEKGTGDPITEYPQTFPAGITTYYAKWGYITGDFTVVGGTPETDYSYEETQYTQWNGTTGVVGVLTILTDTPVTIKMNNGTTNKDSIAVAGNVNANVTLSDVSINVIDKDGKSAFLIQDGASAVITLVGSNTLISGAGEAGLRKGTEGTLTITGGGSLVARGSGSAGIGGSDRSGADTANIIIESGEITAEGNASGAGIGGGYCGNGTNIKILGGKVEAIGGANGAGIGGGSNLDGNSVPDTGRGIGITISGGSVTAIGGEYGGAGIGGGNYCGCGSDISITGGYVIATGQYRAAGIGGGYYNGQGTNIKISGGIVKATAGGDASDIGGGEGGNGEQGEFTGGIVFRGTSGQVYGTVTLNQDLEIKSGETLHIPSGSKLIIPDGVTLTNNGKITYEAATQEEAISGNVAGTGTIEGSAAVTMLAMEVEELGQSEAEQETIPPESVAESETPAPGETVPSEETDVPEQTEATEKVTESETILPEETVAPEQTEATEKVTESETPKPEETVAPEQTEATEKVTESEMPKPEETVAPEQTEATEKVTESETPKPEETAAPEQTEAPEQETPKPEETAAPETASESAAAPAAEVTESAAACEETAAESAATPAAKATECAASQAETAAETAAQAAPGAPAEKTDKEAA